MAWSWIKVFNVPASQIEGLSRVYQELYMSILPSRRLQNLWNHIYPIRYRILWFVPFPTSEQFIIPKDVWKNYGVRHYPFLNRAKLCSRLLNQMALQIKTFQSKTFPATMKKNVSAFKENVPASFFQPTRLGIFREYDRSVAPQCAGRMTDVCAEIDRLATTIG